MTHSLLVSSRIKGPLGVEGLHAPPGPSDVIVQTSTESEEGVGRYCWDFKRTRGEKQQEN